MRVVIWLILLFIVAAVAAALFGGSQGQVTLYWSPWRVDLSLNLFIVLAVLGCVLVYLGLRLLDALVGLPRRAREWRASRRERTAQQALREGWAEFLAGRYARAHKAAERALKMHTELLDRYRAPMLAGWQGPELLRDAEFPVLAHALAAGSMHRLQDREGRDQHLREALGSAPVQQGTMRSADEGLRLMAAEWALDDHDAERALQLLAELPPGLGRRTQALRLRLQAARLAREPLDALRTARLLAKHQAFSPVVAVSLTRTLAMEALDTARDGDQLSVVWQQLDAAERRDAYIAARAASRMAALGRPQDGRDWLQPHWEQLDAHTADERAALCHALVDCLADLPGEWLQRVEQALSRHPNEPDVSYAAGCVYAQAQLWGKAASELQAAALASGLRPAARRDAWRRLALLAEQSGDTTQAAACYRKAAEIGDA